MTKQNLLITLFLLPIFAYAQHINVADSVTNSPVVGASIYLLNQSSGKIEIQGVTDTTGKFTFKISEGDIYISVSAIGYKKALVKYQSIGQTIVLPPYSKNLSEVQVRALKSAVKFNGNSLEYDISQIPNADYRTLTDIIGRLPFLDVDEGKIKILNEPVNILIDNKTNVIYKDAESLKNLPPQAVEKIEVIIVPTARNAGKTINITLKRDYFLGWNGSTSANGSLYGFSPSTNLSYWRKKSGFDISINSRFNTDRANTTTKIFYFQRQQHITSNENFFQKISSAQAMISAYLNISESDALDFQYSFLPTITKAKTEYNILNQTGNIFENDLSVLKTNMSSSINNASLNFTHKFRKPGNAFYILSRASLNRNKKDQILSETFTSNLANNGEYLYNTYNNEYTLEAIMQYNYNKKFKYTVGSKVIWRNNESNNTITNVNQNILMRQLVNSTYVDADWNLKKWTAHFGVRSEYNENSFKAPKQFNSENFAFIPTISLNYTANASNMIILSYTRNLYRPNFLLLSPAIVIGAPYQINSGAEGANNQINNNYGIQYFGNLSNLRLGVNLSYSHLAGALRTISNLDAAGVIQNITYNVESNNTYTLGYSLDFNFLKKFRFSHNNNVSHTSQQSDDIKNSTWGAYLSDRLTYTLNKKNTVDLNLRGHTPNVNFQGLEQSEAFLNFSANYGYFFDWKNKFPVSLNLNVSNPSLIHGLLGYNTTNTNEFALRSESRKRNVFLSASMRIQFKGRKYQNRTFSKEKSIQNYDLSN